MASNNNNGGHRIKTRPLAGVRPLVSLRSLLAVASGLALSAVSVWSYALGLGEIQSQSYLGQPLKARIGLVGAEGSIDPENLQVRQVSAAEAARMGVDMVYTPAELKFQLDRQGQNYQVLVESKGPVKEPFITLLIELSWPSGVVYREYPVLLDPPPLMTAPSSPTAQQPTATASRNGSNASSFVPREPARRPTAVEAQPTVPTVQLEPLNTEAGRYRVQSGDSLWSIAQRWREGTDLTTAQASQWLFENNPEAFVDGDMDKLKAGAELQMPDTKEYQLKQGGAEPAPSEPSAPAEAEPQANPGAGRSGVLDPVQSAAPVDEERPTAEDSVVVNDARGLLTVGADNADDKTRELIDMLVRENESLRSRMETLESSEYLSTLKDLVVVQRRQISDLRSRLGMPESAPTDEVDAMMARIGVDENTVVSTSGTANGDAATNDGEDSGRADSEPEVTSPLAIDASDVKPPVVENDAEKSWLWLLIILAGVVLTGLFVGMYLFYRRHTAAKDEDDDAIGVGHTLPSVTAIHSHRSGLSDGDTLSGAAIVTTHEPDAQLNEAWKPQAGRKRLHDQVTPITDDKDEDFSDLMLDEELLDVLTADEDAQSLEAITQELKPARGRRSDAEVRMSIAEKMSGYRPGDSREQLESLGVMELDDLVDMSNVDEYDVDKVIYRAMMFCDFKKFTQARQLVELVAQEQDDPRLDEALQQIDLLEREHLKRASG